MLDPICKRDGCYMFAPGTPERAECEGSCRLNAQHLAVANDSRELRSSPEVTMYDINNDLHTTLSGRLSATRRLELQFIPSTTYDDAVAAVLQGKLPKVLSCMGVVHDSVMYEFDEGVFDSPDYAALEMRFMAALTNNKEDE